MISSLPTYSVFISLSSEKEKKKVSKDKSNRKLRTEKMCSDSLQHAK